MVDTDTAAILTGPALLKEIKKLKCKSKEDVACATGYFSITTKGVRRPNVRAFYLALLQAKGISLRSFSGSKKEEPIVYKAIVTNSGYLVVNRGCVEKAGLKAGDQVEIVRRGNIINIGLRRPTPARARRRLGDSGEMEQGFKVTVWFATNRLLQGHNFGNRRSSRVTYGAANVYVPHAHRFGEIGSNIFKRFLRCRFADDNLRLVDTKPLGWHEFIKGVRFQMSDARCDGDSPHALLYLHGYNNSFQEAAIRAAQLHVDLKVSGATAFFSWPSRAQITGYAADESTIEASEASIKKFLEDFASQCDADKVHVLAHSMGNRGLLRALQRIAGEAETTSRIKFGQIFMAAPDIDRDLFLELAHLYKEYCERATLYASASDLALAASMLHHRAPRAGYFLPYTAAEGVDTVIVPKFNVDALGHGYFAAAEALLHDIYDLILNNRSPSSRQRIASFRHEDLEMWRFSL
jgi:esterase/lipase superfamily enzyme